MQLGNHTTVNPTSHDFGLWDGSGQNNQGVHGHQGHGYQNQAQQGTPGSKIVIKVVALIVGFVIGFVGFRLLFATINEAD